MPKLPPRLDKNFFLAVYKHSKGAQGLSVQLQIICICTDISISLRLWQRQRGSRYTIHAGRNLPDKEFRYLWTVRVTAAVYRNFSSKPELLPFILRHRAGVSPYTSSYELAETCVFTKQSLPPILCQLVTIARNKLLLLPKLQSHFAEFLYHNSLKRLGLLNQPTCVGLKYGFIQKSFFLKKINLIKDNQHFYNIFFFCHFF